jgi:hypothetical protein
MPNTYLFSVQRATGAVALAAKLAPGYAFRLHEVRIHLSAAGGAGNFTATMDAGAGAAYDTVLKTQDMTSISDFHWQPTWPLLFAATDEVDFAWANAGTKTYGIEIIYERV